MLRRHPLLETFGGVPFHEDRLPVEWKAQVLTEMQGNLAGLLEIDEQVGNGGAGRGIPSLAYWPLITGAVA